MLKWQNKWSLDIITSLTGDEVLTYSIRPMDKEYLVQVNEIDREAFPTQWPPANYRHELQNKLAHYIVACDDTRTIDAPDEKPQQNILSLVSRIMPWARRRSKDLPLSGVKLRYIVGFSGIWMMVDEAHVTNIAVRQQYQGKGLGELLLIATIDMARELKASIMTLEVRASNLAAQSLYSKYGFMHMGIRHGYYLDNREDAIIMSTENINSESFQSHLRQLREALAKKLNQ
jgi:ribosomal-protein-alanine N-acetyltransferase